MTKEEKQIIDYFERCQKLRRQLEAMPQNTYSDLVKSLKTTEDAIANSGLTSGLGPYGRPRRG